MAESVDVLRRHAGATMRQVDTALIVLGVTLSRLPHHFTAVDVPDIERLQFAHEHLLAARTLLSGVARP